jgi:hypothetical protein
MPLLKNTKGYTLESHNIFKVVNLEVLIVPIEKGERELLHMIVLLIHLKNICYKIIAFNKIVSKVDGVKIVTLSKHCYYCYY